MSSMKVTSMSDTSYLSYGRTGAIKTLDVPRAGLKGFGQAIKTVAIVEVLSPVVSFGTRWAFSSLLLWLYRSFRACQALEAVSRVAVFGRMEWSTALLGMWCT